MNITSSLWPFRLVPAFFVLLFALGWNLEARAQNVIATVAPNIGGSNNSVDILNTSGGNWYFYSNPTPSAALMSKMDSSKISESPWGTVGQFYADPSQSQNRIFPGQYLRVYPKNLAVNSVINVEFAYGPSAPRFQFQITIMDGQQVTSIPILDPSPTTASQVRWRVNFTAPISGVTAANFSFTNSANITSLSIASVTPDTAPPSASWTLTANTGSGLGLLGLNWIGHVTESPIVPNSFSGNSYDFSFLPTIDADPVSAGINRNTTKTLSITASLRTGGTPNYQWYAGSSVNPAAATLITGATGSTYTPPAFGSLGAFSYFCRVFTHPNNYRDSAPAIITVVDPPSITGQPTSGYIATGQTRTLSVTASGTSLNYQWYRGTSPNTSNPVGSGTSSYTTPALTANSSYWVRISNAGPTVVNSSTATVGVISSLTSSTPAPAIVNTAYGSLTVTALDSANAPVSGLPITFTAPSGSVPSGRFPSAALSVIANTNASGVATAPLFTANALAASSRLNLSWPCAIPSTISAPITTPPS